MTIRSECPNKNHKQCTYVRTGNVLEWLWDGVGIDKLAWGTTTVIALMVITLFAIA